MLEGPKMLRRPILDVRGTTAGLKQDSESLLVLQAVLAPLYGFQNMYLRLEYSSVARAIEHLFVGRWPEGPAVLREGLWLCWPASLLGYASAYTLHTTAVREHQDYCNSSLSDIVCNFIW